MTNSPDPETTPDSSPASRVTDATAPAEPAAVQAPPADTADGPSFDRIVEPKSRNRLVLEGGVWHQISPKYVTVQLISHGSFLVVVIVAALVLALVLHQPWAWLVGGVLAVIQIWTLAIMPRQARAIGYRLREDDLVFRRGILWQRFVAVPYGRMQLIDITHGPLDRGFGIAQLKFVTAAAATGVVIPGLPQATAETLRDHLIEVAESRRTGL